VTNGCLDKITGMDSACIVRVYGVQSRGREGKIFDCSNEWIWKAVCRLVSISKVVSIWFGTLTVGSSKRFDDDRQTGAQWDNETLH